MINQGKIHILIIEDNPGDVRIIQVMLRDDPLIDYSFSHFDNLKDSLAFLAENEADIALLDLNLPDSTGSETLTRLQDSFPELPIVIISGNQDQKTAIEAVKLGAQDYLVKGTVDGDTLSRVIRHAIERKHAELDLARERAELRALIYNIGDAIITTDTECHITRMNPIAENLTEWKESEAMGKPLIEVFNVIGETSHHEIECPVKQILQTGKVNTQAEPLLLTTPNGKQIPISNSVSIIKDPKGNITGAVLIFRDETDQRISQRILEIRLGLIAFAAGHTLDELITETLDRTSELVDSPIAFYHFLDQDQETITLQEWSTNTKELLCSLEGKGIHYPVDQAGVWVDCVHQKKAVIHNDYASLPHKKGMPEGHAHVIRELVVPIMRDGKIVSIIGVGNKAKDYGEQDVEIVSYLADITWELVSQKRAEDQLNQSEKQYRQIVETAREGMWIINADDTVAFVNQELANMLGYTKEEIVGTNSLHFVLQEDRDLLRDKIRNRQQGIKESYEFRILRKNGKPLWVLISATPNHDRDGKYTGALVMVTDISQRKDAQMKIVQERDRAQKYFDVAGVMLLVLDQQGRIERINHKGMEILGYQKADELIGKKWVDTFIPKDLRPEVRQTHLDLINDTQNAKKFVESRILTRNGEERHIAWYNTTIRDLHGEGNVGTLSSGEDITNRVNQSKQRELLLELSRQAASETDFQKLLFFISEQVIKIIRPAQSASIFLIDHERETSVIKAWAGFGDKDLSDLEIPLQDSITQQLIATRSPVCMNSIEDNPDFVVLESSENEDVKSTIAAPIFFRDKSIDGILYCDNLEKESAFNDQDMAMLETVSNQIAGLIENGRLLEELNTQHMEVEKERDRAQNYLDIAEVMIVALDKNGLFTMVNRKCCDILGYKEQELIGKNWFEVCIPENDREHAWDLYSEFIESKEETGPDYEQVFVTKKGEERVAQWQSRKLKDVNGKTIGTLSSGEDITEKKSADKALRRYEKIVASSSDMMALMDTDLIYLSVNDAYCEAFGLTRNNVLGKHIAELFEKEFFNSIIKPKSEQCLQGEEVVYYEWFEVKGKGRRYMETHYYPYYGHGEKILGLVANRRDITEQHHIQQALKESEEQLSNIIDNSTNLFYSHTPEHIITYISPQSEDILGYKPEEMKRKWTEFATDNPINQEGIVHTERAIKTGVAQPSHDLELLSKSGRRVWVEVHEVPLVEDGKVTAIVGSLTDITSRRRAELEKQQTLAALKIANLDLRSAYDKVQGTMEATIRTIARTVEVRDPYTAGHHRRVSELAVMIAGEMGLEDEMIKAIELAAVIHDLGKIQVPAEILSKPGKLTDIEFGLVKTHPTVGYELLKNIEFPWPLAEIIYMHHERMDGSGYPRGIKANEIPIESRIIGVADTVEAMSSHRPYRAALGLERALDQIEKDRDTIFDPDVVDACLQVFENGYQMPAD